MHKHKVHIVVTDVRLPDGPDGIALARMIKQMTPDIPIILVTAYPELARQQKDELPGRSFTSLWSFQLCVMWSKPVWRREVARRGGLGGKAEPLFSVSQSEPLSFRLRTCHGHVS